MRFPVVAVSVVFLLIGLASAAPHSLPPPSNAATVTLHGRASMQVFVHTAAGKTITLRVDSADSVEAVKTKIHDATGVAPDAQTIIFGGKQLESGHTLQDYRVTPDATLNLVVRLHGGAAARDADECLVRRRTPTSRWRRG